MSAVIIAYKKLVAAGKRDEAEAKLREVFKALDKTVKTKYIKRGKADRMKSRLAKKLKR
jgi:ribosomal protein S20